MVVVVLVVMLVMLVMLVVMVLLVLVLSWPPCPPVAAPAGGEVSDGAASPNVPPADVPVPAIVIGAGAFVAGGSASRLPERLGPDFPPSVLDVMTLASRRE